MENGSSYIIYISDSRDKAKALHAPMYALKGIHEGWEWSVSTVQACEDVRIPALYHGDCYWATIIEHNQGDWRKTPTYELHII